MGFVMQFSAIACALLIGWSGEVGAVWTVRGNSDGAPCVFPFTYKGVDYNKCIDTNWDGVWCATTGSYDADEKWGICTDTPPAGAQANEPEVYTTNGKKCVFPFKAFKKTYNNCTTDYVTVKKPWCSLTDDYDKDRQMGYCDFSRSVACGGFKKLENKFAYEGIEQERATTLDECKKICLDNATCLGFDFNTRNRCYLHFNPSAFNEVYDATGKDVDHYIREVCTTTAAPTTAVMTTAASGGEDTCEDTFELENNTMAFGGEGFGDARSVEECKAECLKYGNETDKYCLAFDYNDKAGLWCYLHFISKNLEFMFPAPGILHYKRVKCIPKNCGDGFNKTENRLSYGGDGRPLLKTLEDCQQGCLTDEKCLAFDYDKTATTTCYHHLSAEFADVMNVNPNAPGVDQYVKVKIPCPEATTEAMTTESTLPPTTKPQKTTRRSVTTKKPPCRDTYEEKKNQLSFGGKEMKNISTLEGCKDVCTKMADCVGVDYNIKNKECFTHDEESFKVIATNPDVNQYIRVKCVVTTTTPVATTAKPTTAAPAPTCVKEFVKTENKHGFGGEENKDAKTVVDCKQACLAMTGCAGLDFNNNDNSCWLLDAAHVEQIADFTGVDHYKMEEDCKATTTPAPTTNNFKTTLKPSCEDSFAETKDSHGLAGKPCPSATNLEDCKKACITNTSCVAIDFVVKVSECWVHMPADGATVKVYPIDGINHYALTRCAAEPTIVVTTTTVRTTTVCEETFTETPNKHAFSGVAIAIAKTLEACKMACIGNTECVALDFQAPGSCWIHVDADKAEVLADLQGVSHYTLDRRCAGTGKQPSSTQTVPTTTTTPKTTITTTTPSTTSTTITTTTPTSTTSTSTTTTTTTTTTPAPTTTTMPAECVADIAMVVDSSGSIRDANKAGRKDNYDLIKEFISMMVGRMRIGSQETRVAAVTFSNYAQIRIPLNQYNSLEPLQTAILDLPYSGGRTNTTGALRLARTEVFTEANGDRPNVKNIIVLITDGNTTVEASKLSDEVQRVKDADITVFGIGVTEGINKNELKSMVSEPISTHFFTVDDFNQLIGVLENVILGTCAKQTTPAARR